MGFAWQDEGGKKKKAEAAADGPKQGGGDVEMLNKLRAGYLKRCQQEPVQLPLTNVDFELVTGIKACDRLGVPLSPSSLTCCPSPLVADRDQLRSAALRPSAGLAPRLLPARSLKAAPHPPPPAGPG